MKFIKSLLLVISASFFTGCSKFAGTDQSVWAEGLWLIPWILIAGIGVCAYQVWKGKKAQPNVDLTTMGFFWWGLVLFVALLVVIISVNVNR